MRKCKYCGEELDELEEQADCCPYCGKEIDVKVEDTINWN